MMDVLHLPVDQLAKLSMCNLKNLKTLERASKSSLYREKWNAAKINAEDIEGYEDFSKLPFLTSKELRMAIYESPIEQILCSKVAFWFCSTGTTGTPKWIPYGRRDIELFMEIRDRTYGFLPTMDNLRTFTVSTPSPYIEDGLVALNLIRGMQNRDPLEGVTVCVSESQNEEMFNFALDTKPEVILAFPSFAARFAEIVEEKAPETAKKQFDKRKSLKNLVLYLITRFKKIRPKDLSKFKWGLFGGEPLDPYREVLNKAFGLEPYEMYLSTEFMPPAMECRIHNGMHLWMDICLPEIIPEPELEKEIIDSAYTPRAIPLWEAEQGQKGEYVLTTFGEALPLIRYRTGDLIEVVGIEPCGCGFTHPRIKVPRRSDASTVCLGPIRFTSSVLGEKILSTTKYGRVQRWQLEICREGYRPKMIIRVEPCGEISDKEAFLKEIQSRLLEITMLKTGIQNKLVAEPEVIIGAFLSGGHAVAKAGCIICEGEKGSESSR